MNGKYPPSSRYYNLETATLEESPGGPQHVYLKRRFLPAADRLALLQEHTVESGDRIDNLAARYLGDPEQFWHICDANSAMFPDDLFGSIGRKLRITLPQGVMGPARAT